MGYEKQDTSKTNQELLEEISALKSRIQELELSESERKQVEKEELANQLKFQQTLIDTIPHPIFFKDSGGRFVGCNRAYEREFGTTRDYMIGKNSIGSRLSADGRASPLSARGHEGHSRGKPI